MSEFKKGDRVKYIGGNWPKLKGFEGTVTGLARWNSYNECQTYKVNFDKDPMFTGNETRTVMSTSLELINKEKTAVKSINELTKADVYVVDVPFWQVNPAKGVLDTHSGRHMTAARAAEDAGKDYYVFGGNGSGEGLFRTATGLKQGASNNYVPGPRYDQLPEGSTATLAEKVIEYIMQPGRSTPNKWLSDLGEAGFLTATPERQVEIINGAISNGTICGTGAKKLRAFLGDLLPDPKPITKTIRVVLDVDIVDHPSDHFASGPSIDSGVVPALVQTLTEAGTIKVGLSEAGIGKVSWVDYTCQPTNTHKVNLKTLK